MLAFLFVLGVIATFLFFLLVRPPKRLQRVSAIGNMVVQGFITLGPSKIKVPAY